MIFIGIDGGPKGGIVALSPCAGLDPILAVPMPTIKQGGKDVVDGKAAASIIRNIPWGAEGIHIALEDLPHHSQSKAAMRSMALNFGRLCGALEARILCDRATMAVIPAGNSKISWQRAMLSKTDAGTKADAALAATLIWPEFRWPKDGKSYHDGIIDAALIAEHARRLKVQRRLL